MLPVSQLGETVVSFPFSHTAPRFFLPTPKIPQWKQSPGESWGESNKQTPNHKPKIKTKAIVTKDVSRGKFQ